MSNDGTPARRSERGGEHAPVREDPALDPPEKENHFRFAKSDDQMRVTAKESALVRRLLAHPLFTLDWCQVLDDESVEYRDETPEEDEGVTIVAVSGWAPVALLKMLRYPRTTGGHAEVITDEVYRKRRSDGRGSAETDSDARADGGDPVEQAGRGDGTGTPTATPSGARGATRDLADRLGVDDEDLREDLAAWLDAVRRGGGR